MMLLALLLLAPPPDIAARAAALEARAQAHHDAREYVQAATAFVELSSLPGVDVDKTLGLAHANLEAAFGATQEARHMCRALRLARGRLAHHASVRPAAPASGLPEAAAPPDEGSSARAGELGPPDDEGQQLRLFWEETVTEDLDQLAELGGEANCPPPARVAILEEPPEVVAPEPQPSAVPLVDAVPQPTERRLRARRAAGFTLTGVGVGLAGLMGAALAGYRHGYRVIKAASERPEGFMYSEAEAAAFGRVYADTRMLKGMAIGLGVASAAALATGIGLLASHRRVARRTALLPSSMPRGGGLVLRLRF